MGRLSIARLDGLLALYNTIGFKLSLNKQTTRALVIALVGLFVVNKVLYRPSAPLPPGPPRLPFLGNIRNWPKEQQWETYTQWSREYGEVVYASILGQPLVILNSRRVVRDLLEKRGAIYSDRPTRTMSDLTGISKMTSASPYNDRLRKLRGLILRDIGAPAIVERNALVSELYTHKFILKPVIQDSARLMSHVNKASAALALRLQCGYEAQEGFDPMVDLSESTTHYFSRIVAPGAFLVDSFPFLRHIPAWFPGVRFHAIAEEARNGFEKFREVPFAYAKQQIATGTAQPSFFSDSLAESQTEDMETFIKYAGNSIFAGASDTTASMNYSFFLAMTLYPDVQARAQAEIDSVIGPSRLPKLADRADLPYVNALVLEVLRWHQVLPQSLPRKLREDDVYEGYLIPKGAIIIPNIWGMLHDPAVYKDPFEFRPERFLGSAPEPDPTEVCFGFGRRICPGEHVGRSSIFLACAMSLATLEISKAVDENGNVIVPAPKITSGINVHFENFPLAVRARSKETEALINDIDFHTT